MLILVMLVTVTVYMRLISRLGATREDVSIM
jgi:spermidine/putrescine transport system permease protein